MSAVSSRCVLLLACAANAFTGIAAAQDCDSIANEPVRTDVDFETEIQPFLSGGGSVSSFCSDCHTVSSRGGLNVLPQNVRVGLLGADEQGAVSANYPEWRRVVPGHPRASLVFHRMHCDTFPGRMPPGARNGDAEFIRFQALMHDWIATGAIMDSTDRRSSNGFEDVR